MPVAAPLSSLSEPLSPHRRLDWTRECRKGSTRHAAFVALAKASQMTEVRGARTISSSPDGPQDGTLWMRSAGAWLLGALVPNIVLASASEKVLAMEHWQIGGLLLLVDCIFVATSFKFLDLAGSFDRDWHKTTIEYPGPAWGSAKGDGRDSNQGKLPFMFKGYVQLFLGAGILLPLCAVPASFAFSEHGVVAAAVLTPYLATLATQISQELILLKQKSAQWPIVPVHHMYYRFLQLARGAFLVAALQGPDWLMWLIVGLASLWFFNAGAVMTWNTSLMYYHRQPPFDLE